MVSLKEELLEIVDYYGDSQLLLRVEIPSLVFPCPRPQVVRSRSGGTIAYYPEEYSQNKKKIKEYTEEAIKKYRYSPPESVLVLVKYYGVEQIGPKSSRDGDNMLKTVFDSITDAGALARKDTLGEVPCGIFRWIPESLDAKTEVLIYEVPPTGYKQIRKINRKVEKEKTRIQQRV